MNKNEIEDTLNLWASAVHHRAGLADSHPDPDDVRNEPRAVGTARYTNATQGRTNDEVVCAIEAIERALSKLRAPDWLRAYLLFKHPRTGRYEPKRRLAGGTCPVFDAPEAFVLSGHMAHVTGNVESLHVRESSIRLVRAMERAFFDRLKDVIANRS